ncbi:sulfatase-like hydrolase/transferase [Carboxylicivirga sediminis]|uniref:Sulfatase-like hydrolase/transferase n=1 Tax=Carboxylicivirga sediminis TaxID=2006564 RepID=A0A941F4M2_9BACT|nr:sulfatase-like hydrolase/transferase [Carboxylicivirga sediminis]MBR8535853.1 sulfatase-like hydrolase/transferase [Carboxylicivirga sediminis]
MIINKFYFFRIWVLLALGFVSCDNTDIHNSMKPNVLLLVADDLGYGDCSAYTHHAPDVSTPNIDKLAERGVLFTQGYVTAQICSPSRAGLLTGRYQQRWGVHTYTNAAFPNNELTIAEYLRDKGYSTALFGKSHLGQADDIMSPEYPLRHGFERFVGRTGGMIDYLKHSFEDQMKYPKPLNVYWGFGPWYFDDSVKEVEGYTTDIITNEALQFIDKNKKSPFFLMMGYTEVHAWTHQMPDSALTRLGIEKIEDWDPEKEEALEWVVRDGIGPYMADGRTRLLWHLSQLDKSVGKIISKLKENEILENTIIIFLSDNGSTKRISGNNGPLSGGKYLLEEGGIRVPYIISFPQKLPCGVNYKPMVSSMDIFPTICNLAGLEHPENVDFDGKDLVPFLKNSNAGHPHDELYWTGLSFRASEPSFEDMNSVEAKSYYSVGGDDSGWAVRKNNFKLRYFGRTDEYKLYDLDNDPGEQNDLSLTIPEITQDLKERYKQWHAGMNLPEIEIK